MWTFIPEIWSQELQRTYAETLLKKFRRNYILVETLMLTDLRQAPIIDDDTFMPRTRKLLLNEPVTIKGQIAAWVETDGLMYCNDDVHKAVAVLVPLSHLSTKEMWEKKPVSRDSWDREDPYCTQFPYDKDVVLSDENGGGMLNSYSIVLQTTDGYAAHVFNGHANELIRFTPDDELADVFDTVYTMFAVTGSENNE